MKGAAIIFTGHQYYKFGKKPQLGEPLASMLHMSCHNTTATRMENKP
jgi:hypothetical protein